MTLNDHFERFAKKCIQRDITEEQYQAARATFFAGASVAFNIMNNASNLDQPEFEKNFSKALEECIHTMMEYAISTRPSVASQKPTSN